MSTHLRQDKTDGYSTRNRPVTKPVEMAVNETILYRVHLLEDLINVAVIYNWVKKHLNGW